MPWGRQENAKDPGNQQAPSDSLAKLQKGRRQRTSASEKEARPPEGGSGPLGREAAWVVLRRQGGAEGGQNLEPTEEEGEVRGLRKPVVAAGSQDSLLSPPLEGGTVSSLLRRPGGPGSGLVLPSRPLHLNLEPAPRVSMGKGRLRAVGEHHRPPAASPQVPR